MTIFHRQRKTDPGQSLVLLRNMSGQTLLRGSAVILDTQTLDGVRVTIPSAGKLGLFKGILWGDSDGPADLVDGAYGLFQTGGYCDYALVANHGANNTVVGDVLGLVAGQVYLQRLAAGDGRPAFAHALEAIASNAVISSSARRVDLGHGC